MQQSWGSDFERTADSRNQQQTDQDKPQNGAWGRGGMAIKFKRERTFLFIIFEIGDFGTPLIELRPCNNQ